MHTLEYGPWSWLDPHCFEPNRNMIKLIRAPGRFWAPYYEQELISRLDSRTLRPINVLGLLVFSNNIKDGTSDIRDIKRRIMACLEIWVKDHPRSLKMTQFKAIYDFLLVCHCNYSYTLLQLSDIQNIVTFKPKLGVTQGHWKWHHSINRIRVPIRLSL